MKIHVEFLSLPMASEIIGKTKEISIPSTLKAEAVTINELVKQLVDQFGHGVATALLDEGHHLDPVIQVMVNDEGFLAREDYAQRGLQDGDRVRFMLLVGGG